jgi:glycosyltransferase involved in cell wall biosynthesis
VSSSTPLMTVLMPFYNARAFLAEAVESVLAQTFEDFEVLFIDDGSAEPLRPQELPDDPRLEIVRLEENSGLSAALNLGMERARTEFLVRMDPDDVCRPGRFERQLAFLRSRPEVDLCATGVRFIGDRSGEWVPPATHEEIQCHLFFHTALAHPSIVMRREALLRGDLRYNTEIRAAIDYDFFVRCARSITMAAIEDILLDYRFHKKNMSTADRSVQDESADSVRLQQLALLGLENDPRIRLHHDICMFYFDRPGVLGDEAQQWLDDVEEANNERRAFPLAPFSAKVNEFRNHLNNEKQRRKGRLPQ